MNAKVGDVLLFRARHTDEQDREAEVVEVRGENGRPPYLVRWTDGHETLVFPGSDAVVKGLARQH